MRVWDVSGELVHEQVSRFVSSRRDDDFAATGVQAEWWSSPTYVNWTGFYLGGQGTYRWAGADVNWGVDVPGLGTGKV